MIGVYAIVHRESGRRYIGSSKCVEKRWGQHLNLLTHGRHHSPYLQHAWTKYGAEAFDFVVVEQCAQQELLSREQAWIDWSRSPDPSFGFNLSERAGRPAIHRPPEFGRKIAASLRGQKLSEERKAKISAAHMGKVRGPHSELHKERIRQASLKHRHSPESLAKIKAHHWSHSENAADVVARTNESKRRARDVLLAPLKEAEFVVTH